MKDSSTHIVIMAGGSGTRFWPLSTTDRPKQLLPLISDKPLIVDAVNRLIGLTSADCIWIITSDHLCAPISDGLSGVLDSAQVIGEPCQRDTAGCIALGAAIIARSDPDGVMAIMTADHAIGPVDMFHSTVRTAVDLAREQDSIVVFGIKPASPLTLYGYIHRSGDGFERDGYRIYDVESFREKPDDTTARKYYSSGQYYWNSGMFVWTVRHIIECFKKFLPDHYRFIDEFVSSEKPVGEFREAFGNLPKISIDYGIMEKAERVHVIEAPFEWDDVGSWLALERHKERNPDGNTIIGSSITVDTTNSILYCDDDSIIATAGIRDLVIVSTGKAVLVVHKDETARIKEIVAKLKEHENGRFL